MGRRRESLSKISVLPAVGKTPSGQGGRPTVEYYLNPKQAIFITFKSGTEFATEVTIETIERFDALERGLRPKQQPLSARLADRG